MLCLTLSLSLSLALQLSWALFNSTICVNVIKISFVKAPKSPTGQGERHSVALVDHTETMLLLLLLLPLLLLLLSDTVGHITRSFEYCALEKSKQRCRESELTRAASVGAAALPLWARLMFAYLLPSLHARQAWPFGPGKCNNQGAHKLLTVKNTQPNQQTNKQTGQRETQFMWRGAAQWKGGKK